MRHPDSASVTVEQQPAGDDRRRGTDLLFAFVLWGAFAAALPLLAAGLPSRAFYVGDPGLKLIAARNAIEHPARPFDIDLPRIGTEAVDLVDSSFRVHGDHAHITTSELFPLISAPLIAAFGLGGAYVLPPLGFLLALGATAAVGVALDRARSRTAIVFSTAACTPLLFYALEFWEHALAVGLAALATLLLVRRRSRLGLFACGVLLGVTVLLRPEAAWYSVALLVGTAWLPSRFGIKDLATVLVGMAVACLPSLTLSFVHSGQLLGGHVARNMSGLSQDWWSDRAAILAVWLVPSNVGWLVGCVLLAVAAVAARTHAAARRAVQVAGVAFVTAAAVAAARRMFGLASVWNAAPAVLLLLAIPVAGDRRGRKFLCAVAFVFGVLVAVTAPNDGGSQWGPRYLLFAFIPGAILVADALDVAVRSSRLITTIGVALVVISSLLVQRNAYKELQGAKRTYERLVGLVERETSPGDYVVTDLWWFEQVTAALYPNRVVLFVDSAGSAQRAFGMLSKAQKVVVVRSDVESPPDSFERWFDGTRLAIDRQVRVPERALTLFRLTSRR